MFSNRRCCVQNLTQPSPFLLCVLWPSPPPPPSNAQSFPSARPFFFSLRCAGGPDYKVSHKSSQIPFPLLDSWTPFVSLSPQVSMSYPYFFFFSPPWCFFPFPYRLLFEMVLSCRAASDIFLVCPPPPPLPLFPSSHPLAVTAFPRRSISIYLPLFQLPPSPFSYVPTQRLGLSLSATSTYRPFFSLPYCGGPF